MKTMLAGFLTRNRNIFAGVAMIFAVQASGFAQQVEVAPTNPEFIKTKAATGAGEVNFGYRPGPMDLSHTKLLTPKARQGALAFAAAYDLRTDSKMTAVRNQGAYGTCWAHAAYGSMESVLLTGETRDFSENNMANWHGGDWGFDDGGNAWLAAAYLARWSGPYDETADPYPNVGAIPLLGSTVQKHVQNVLFLPERSSPTDNDAIKQAIVDHGALYCAFYWDGTKYNAATQGFYNNATTSANHAVTLAGWDDNYAAANFNTAPAGNGAFLIKNSWGTGWGNVGYFWISYYDTSFQEVTCFYGAEATNNYSTVQQYDTLGWVSSFGTGSTDSFYGANIFIAPAASTLEAVSFYFAANDSQADISIYTGVTAGQPTSGTLSASQTFTATVPGYYTVQLDSTPALANGERYSVVVNFTTPGYNWPTPIEYAVLGYSSAATANPGESYYSSNGAAWTDITTWNVTCNICIKAYLDLTLLPGNDLAVGSLFSVDCPTGLFHQKPKVYATYFDPVKDPGQMKEKKATAKVLTKVDKVGGNAAIDCEWTKKVKLYDAKAFKVGQAAGEGTVAWIAANQENLDMVLHVASKEVPDQPVQAPTLAAPEILTVTAGTSADDKPILTLEGYWFGTKKPKVWREYTVLDKGPAIKQQKFKVLAPDLTYTNAKGKPSCMDPATGRSKVVVLVPADPKGELNSVIVLENGVGLAATD